MKFDEQFQEMQGDKSSKRLKIELETLIQTGELGKGTGQLVGDVYSIGYDSAKVIIHDRYRQKVGGIPA